MLSHNIYAQIQVSGQRIKYFHSTQIRCGLPEALKIPLHSNIQWGTAFKMLDQANKLRQVWITDFIVHLVDTSLINLTANRIIRDLSR